MASFGHGGNAKEISRENKLEYEKIIDFSANINPLGMPCSVKKAIIQGVDQIEKYPDITYFELKKAIGEFENISEEDIVIGNGAAEVLFNVVRGIKPNNALILAPTFSEYEEAVRAESGNITYYELKEENNFYIKEDILDYIDDNLDLIFICNPNNPTGVLTERNLLIKVLEKALKKNVIVVIDESFLDFVDESFSMISYIEAYKNLIIVKSLTKFFALPGLRIGYGICHNSEIKAEIEKVSPAWNINILAEIATKVGLKDENYIQKSKKYISIEKEYLYNNLTKINKLKVFKPSVNFIFFKTLIDINLKEELLSKNILVRSCSNYKGLDNSYYRIAIRNNNENAIFIDNINNLFEEYGEKE